MNDTTFSQGGSFTLDKTGTPVPTEGVDVTAEPTVPAADPAPDAPVAVSSKASTSDNADISANAE